MLGTRLFRRLFRPAEQKKLLISIGAGINQVPLINCARKNGYSVIGVDMNIASPGLFYSDLRIQESILNYNEIYNRIQELLVDGIIVGALTRSYGEAVRTTAFINEKLNVPYIPVNRIDDLIDKKKMKSVFHKAEIPTPAYRVFDQKRDSKDYPFILKPSKGHAKHGVRLIKGSADLESYLETFPVDSSSPLIKEQYIGGDEIIAAGIASEGVFHLAEITDKITTNHPFFVDIRHQTPSKYFSRWDEIESIGQQIVEAFDIQTSPVFIELRFDGEGKPFVIEVVPEFGGEFLADILIPAHTGYPFMEQCINAVARKGFVPPVKCKNRNAVIVQYITSLPGTLVSHEPLPRQGRSGILFCRMFKEIGSSVKKPENNHDRIGVIAARASTIDEAVSLALSAEKSLQIVIKPSRKQKA
jgi:biotin carboxylase